MILPPPRSTRPDTLFPYPTLVRAGRPAEPQGYRAGARRRDRSAARPRLRQRTGVAARSRGETSRKGEHRQGAARTAAQGIDRPGADPVGRMAIEGKVAALDALGPCRGAAAWQRLDAAVGPPGQGVER